MTYSWSVSLNFDLSTLNFCSLINRFTHCRCSADRAAAFAFPEYSRYNQTVADQTRAAARPTSAKMLSHPPLHQFY
jgi:hypothetical protein